MVFLLLDWKFTQILTLVIIFFIPLSCFFFKKNLKYNSKIHELKYVWIDNTISSYYPIKHHYFKIEVIFFSGVKDFFFFMPKPLANISLYIH